jgi:S-adenosylmethionine:tRNA ribosyltransferase-isomerase
MRIGFSHGLSAIVEGEMESGRRLVRFSQAVEDFLPEIGNVPLPPYIHHQLNDPERYQTIFAHEKGSAAAPTAGLHFTPTLVEQLKKKGVQFAEVLLHIGLDTFAPVTEEDPRTHQIHSEWCEVSPVVVEQVKQAKANGKRVIAVGTTSVRSLESAATGKGKIEPYCGSTQLFILPGYDFKIVDTMITNFHLPKSSLIMLVSAFAGRERILTAYAEAIQNGYRFYSFGDAMLIL